MVPNHMAASTQNPWWYDVLENGPNSPYAHFFDIDWHPVKPELANRCCCRFSASNTARCSKNGS